MNTHLKSELLHTVKAVMHAHLSGPICRRIEQLQKPITIPAQPWGPCLSRHLSEPLRGKERKGLKAGGLERSILVQCSWSSTPGEVWYVRHE
eukprot:1147721-Pelagomonas_calceolata.AAC.1